MREKGVITQAEYDSAVKDLGETSGAHVGEEGTLVVSKWAATIYGFVEADNIVDTTSSFNDLAGTAAVARASSEAGRNPRFTMAMRNSRLGFRMKAPEFNGIRASGVLEMDFLGTQLPVCNNGQGYCGSEGAFFSNATMRIRHGYLKVETPIVDILAGQYWQLFGWQSVYNPNTVEIQGVPGELFARSAQLRVSKTIKASPIIFEMAVAASRPVDRDSGFPDGQGGIRFGIDAWQGVQTVGSTGTQTSPLSIAATGVLRHVAVNNFSATPTYTNELTMGAFAIDGFLPIIPGTKEHRGNSLSLNGEFVRGSGIADFYTGLTGGASFGNLPLPAGAAPGTAATPFAANIDNGIVAYDSNATLHSIDWQTYLVGGQYYLPGVDGKIFVSGNYSHIFSDNIALWTSAANTGKVTSVEDWFDVNLFLDPTPSVRVGLEYANFNTQYVDGQHAINHRGQLSGFFIF
jgi:hypothetical protein